MVIGDISLIMQHNEHLLNMSLTIPNNEVRILGYCEYSG